jgi:hypothetical protein
LFAFGLVLPQLGSWRLEAFEEDTDGTRPGEEEAAFNRRRQEWSGRHRNPRSPPDLNDHIMYDHVSQSHPLVDLDWELLEDSYGAESEVSKSKSNTFPRNNARKLDALTGFRMSHMHEDVDSDGTTSSAGSKFGVHSRRFKKSLIAGSSAYDTDTDRGHYDPEDFSGDDEEATILAAIERQKQRLQDHSPLSSPIPSASPPPLPIKEGDQDCQRSDQLKLPVAMHPSRNISSSAPVSKSGQGRSQL